MNNEQYNFLYNCSQNYLDELKNDILPFWLKYGLDTQNGGVYTCLDRDGTLIDPTKSVWFQGRFAYITAYAYNNVEKREEWLDASRSCIDFLEKHCFDTDGHMFFEVTAQGVPLRRRRYVFSECFAIIAMAEYSKTTNSSEYAQKALALLKSTLKKLATPNQLPSKYLDTLETRGHSITMILINTALSVKSVCDDPILDELIAQNVSEIGKYFLKPEFKALLETVDMDGNFIDTGMGRVINPGHAIETAWFLMDAAAHVKNSEEVIKIATTILDWSWEWGWDKEHGGIINLRDCKNLPPQDYSQDMKFWWPQCEAIIATLYAYKLTGDSKYLDMHKKIHEWTYKHFPDSKYGEWYGYLHRDGRIAQPAKGNIFKGPFHIPRMMIKSHLLIETILPNQ